MAEQIKIVVTDLDGTLLPSMGEVSRRNYKCLEDLKESNITRVIATGRTLYSAMAVLPDDFPIDYLIFSSGAGIMNWENKQLIYSQQIDAKEVQELSQVLIDHKTDFMILDPIPLNHQFWYYQGGNKNSDFDRRLNLYKQFATPVGKIEDTRRDACQLLAILPNKEDWFEELKNKFDDIKIIRATSPLDHESIWMEIFPLHISKGHGCEWLCKKLGLKAEDSFVIGNDYNDIDLLEWGKHSYVVDNAPKELKDKYKTTENVIRDGFAIAVEKTLNSVTSQPTTNRYL
ncbi:HAD-IIB family hydrolase [Marinifilum sp. N1E240]|uniref:HAD family hydrolase n=1 Tax=Marinifilum sp. N1E240 TaxID=2608082 RepID=UPI00128D317C|nr:HAD family hydrolase [Marinifilum sp. N1E240]MPQ48105.1 HAD-IIB family hydrolase [Marinifilum sp. N1E240]